MSRPVPKQEFIDFFLGKSIAIVGNARAIRNRGKEIDAHDIVVRFNNFQIKGYEDLVGTRTDVWVSGGGWDILPRFGIPYNYQWYPHKPPQDFNLSNQPLFIHDKLDFVKQWKSDYPISSGLQVIGWFYQHGFQFDCYGFDGCRSPHYFKDVRTSVSGDHLTDDRAFSKILDPRSSAHDYKAEGEVFTGFQKYKLVEAVTTNKFMAQWAITKFHKVQPCLEDVNPNNLAAILQNTMLTDNAIRQLTAGARIISNVCSKATIFRTP